MLQNDTLLDDLWAAHNQPGTAAPGLFVLVDHAGAPSLMSRLRRAPSLRWHSLFAGSKEDGALEVAPILVALGELEAPPSHAVRELLDWLCSTCTFNHSTLWLRSNWSFDALAKALTARLDASLPDRLPVMLRYFDTRVFNVLTTALTPEQAAAFFVAADRWSWWDRAGELRHFHAEPEAIDRFDAPLVISEGQEAHLIEAAEPDAIIHLMQRTAADLCAAQTPAALHATVSANLPVAKRYGIEDPRQQALFCLTELESGPKFFELPVWRKALDGAGLDGGDFDEVLRQMENSL
jgi:Domain of unknown function (DUF4123)